MAYRRLLQAAFRSPTLGSTTATGLQGSSIGLPALQHWQSVWQASPLLRQFSASLSEHVAEPEVTDEALSHGESRQPRERPRNRQARSKAGTWQADRRPPRQPRLYIPKAWEQQGRAVLDVPLVREVKVAVDRGDAWEARRAFEAALFPLKDALQRGEDPATTGVPVPPPYAWKLYFAALGATNCHAHHMSELIDVMARLGVEPQAACYVIALRQMAMQGIGSPAYTTILRMKEAGLPPTLHSYMYAIESCLRSSTPELSYARRLFSEVDESKLAVHASQQAELGKLIMHAVREFARYRRFDSATTLLGQLERLGLRVPAFLVADVLYLATLARDVGALMECVGRLERTTSTFQVASGEVVTRPLKVEEGLLLEALEVAANRGHVQLAEATWRLLERSVALPNTPSTAGSLNKVAAQQQAQAQQQAAAGWDSEPAAYGADVADSEAAGDAVEVEEEGGGSVDAPDPTAPSDWVSDELEASDAAAAAAADEAARQGRPPRGGAPRGQPGDPAVAGDEAVAGVAAEKWGVRQPSLFSHLALVHAYAKAGHLEGMFGAVERMQQAYPHDPSAASYYEGLPVAVDVLAESLERCDAAFYLLEAWAKEGRTVSTAQLNLVAAACCQIGDLKRAFETFDAYESLGVTPDTDTYNALMQGCIESGEVETALKVLDQMQAADVQPNSHTHHLLVQAGIVTDDVPSMMRALEAIEAAGHTPRLALLEQCVARAERAGARGPVKELLHRLFKNDYRIVGLDAKCRRWLPEGGMTMLTGSRKWFNREEVLREMRKNSAISNREARKSHGPFNRSEQHAGDQDQNVDPAAG